MGNKKGGLEVRLVRLTNLNVLGEDACKRVQFNPVAAGAVGANVQFIDCVDRKVADALLKEDVAFGVFEGNFTEIGPDGLKIDEIRLRLFVDEEREAFPSNSFGGKRVRAGGHAGLPHQLAGNPRQ